MSEKLHPSKHHEVQKPHEAVEKARARLEELKAKAELDAKEHASAEHIDAVKHKVEEEAVSGEEYMPAEMSQDSAAQTGPAYVNRELKDMSFRRTLKNTQRQLNAPERAVSKVIHQPIVEKVSEVASVTVARPSGILGGGICALLGSLFLFWLTKKYGYEYNYLAFFILFVGGFMLGMIAELVLKTVYRRKRI